MASVTEQEKGIGRTALFFLALVSLLCVSLIGGAGFLKYQLDRATYVITSTYTDIQATSSLNTEITPQTIQKTNDAVRIRREAERDLRNWSLGLTFISWISLIFAAALIISIYLIMQRRQSPALRALSQSAANLARGDMQTPVWGIDRHDTIGDLARTIEQARLNFSQIPDLTMMSEQGHVRLKFEGGARTLFDAMMQQITAQASRVGEEAADLAATAASQHKVMTDLPLRVNAALEQIQRMDKTNGQAVQRASQSITTAANQLEKLIPFMQSRAQNMAEVTQMAGTQVASTLRNMVEAEHSLRGSTTKSQQTVDGLSTSTKELGERIFAALNLLQASSKVLNETTESSQSRLKELIETLNVGESKLNDVVARVETRLEATAKAEESLSTLAERTETSTERMDNVINAITERHDILSEKITQSTEKLDTIMSSFTGAEQALSSALETIHHDGGLLNEVFQDLKVNNEQVLAKLSRTSQTGHEVVQHLAECSQSLMDQMQERLSTQSQAVQNQIDDMAKQNSSLTSQAIVAADSLSHVAEQIAGAEHKFNSIHDRFAAIIHNLGETVEKQVADSFGRTEELTSQNLEKLSGLTSSVDQALQRLAVLGQLTSTLGTVAGQLGQLIPSLGNNGDLQHTTISEAPEINIEAIANKLSDDLTEHFQALINQIKPPKPTPVIFDASNIDMTELSDKMMDEFEERWKSSINMIDQVRDDLASLMERQKDHLEMRLVVLDKQIKTLATTTKQPDPQQVGLLREIVTTLGAMNDHLSQIQSLDSGIQQPEAPFGAQGYTA